MAGTSFGWPWDDFQRTFAYVSAGLVVTATCGLSDEMEIGCSHQSDALPRRCSLIECTLAQSSS
jgi:hypothetical protein